MTTELRPRQQSQIVDGITRSWIDCKRRLRVKDCYLVPSYEPCCAWYGQHMFFTLNVVALVVDYKCSSLLASMQWARADTSLVAPYLVALGADCRVDVDPCDSAVLLQQPPRLGLTGLPLLLRLQGLPRTDGAPPTVLNRRRHTQTQGG